MKRKSAAMNNIGIDRVHWASYAGKNFTHRQCIKRKAQRLGEPVSGAARVAATSI